MVEVAEIVHGLSGWKSDPDATIEDRRVLADLQDAGIETVEWLVHPANAASIAFSRNVFPEADETQPPDDQPYVCFIVGL